MSTPELAFRACIILGARKACFFILGFKSRPMEAKLPLRKFSFHGFRNKVDGNDKVRVL
jgi:hypothetical protein